MLAGSRVPVCAKEYRHRGAACSDGGGHASKPMLRNTHELGGQHSGETRLEVFGSWLSSEGEVESPLDHAHMSLREGRL